MRFNYSRVNRARSMNKQAQVQFLLDLLSWLKNGCSTLQALQMMRACATEVKDKPVLATVNYIAEQLAKGRNLGACLERHFSADLVMVMKSSHDPHVLLKTLSEVQALTAARIQIRTQAVSRLLYPLVLLLVCVLAVWITGAVILPRLTQMLGEAQLPLWSRQLALLAKLMPWLVLALLAFVLGLFSLRYLLQGVVKGRVSALLKKLKVSQVYRLFILVDICYQLGLLLGQRCNMGEAVFILKQSAKGLAEKHYQFMQSRLAAGYVSLAEVMHSELVDSITLMRLQMSHGTALERGVQLHEIAQSMQQRALRLLHRNIGWTVLGCYSTALLLIASVVLGLGQVIMLMVGQWT